MDKKFSEKLQEMITMPNVSWPEFWEATYETLYMTVISTLFSFIFGLIIGVILFLTSKSKSKVGRVFYSIV
ncbi:ABC transporter permease, partial [Staphylococcus equorum]